MQTPQGFEIINGDLDLPAVVNINDAMKVDI